jgi:hypothetical protein
MGGAEETVMIDDDKSGSKSRPVETTEGAMDEYRARQKAERAKSVKLRELRLAAKAKKAIKREAGADQQGKARVIAGLQIRAARAFLVWDRRDLSRKAAVPFGTIEQLETGTKVSGKAMTSALTAVQAALEAEGIEFTEDDGVLGVRLHPNPARTPFKSKDT